MIRRLNLVNFKGIQEADIELEPLSIFIGSNNSGKTSILEALYLAPYPMRDTPYISDRSGSTPIHIINQMHAGLDDVGFSFLLNNYNSRNTEIICSTDSNVKQYLKFEQDKNQIKIYFKQESLVTDSNDIESYYVQKNNLNYREVASLSGGGYSAGVMDQCLGDSIFINDDLIKNAYKHLRSVWSKIYNTGVLAKVAKKASELSNDKYTNFTIEPFLSNKLTFNAYFKNGNRIRVGDLGQGMQNYVVAQLLCEIGDYDTILWDDIEAHLNPKIMLDLSMWFYDLLEQKKQIILSTHSLDVLKTICGVNEEKAWIYLTNLVDGKLKYKKMKYAEFEEYLDSGIDVRVAEDYLL